MGLLRRIPFWAWGISAGLHVAGALSVLALRPTHDERTALTLVVDEHESSENGRTLDLSLTERDRVVDEARIAQARAGDLNPHPDQGRAGRGGSEASRALSTNLADKVEDLALRRENVDDKARDQASRLRSSNKRRAWEDRRQSREPMEMTFVAVGKRGTSTHESVRRASSSTEGTPFTREGGASNKPPHEGVEPASVAGVPTAPGGRRFPPSRDAQRARARPDVSRASPSVQASTVGKPSDTQESELQRSTASSLVEASGASAREGVGNGGQAGGAETGAGGTKGEGSQAKPLGAGGDVWDLDQPDPYLRSLRAVVHRATSRAFPMSAAYALKQGYVIVGLTIASNGALSVAWPPVRRSGIDEFDANCVEALRKVGRVLPLPADRGSSMRVLARIEGLNPVIP